MERLKHLDLFTGIGGVYEGAKRNGFETIMTSEIDTYCTKLIDQLDLENAGDIRLTVIPRDEHPHAQRCLEADVVPCEEDGITSLTIEDFMEGIVPYPDLASGGFPCVKVTSANIQECHLGIEGEHSDLVQEQLRIIDELQPPYAMFENSRYLNIRGLSYILAELDHMGYWVEYETISAAAFGYPHYRHRIFIVAYKPYTQIAQKGLRIFDGVREDARRCKGFCMPLLEEDPDRIRAEAIVENPKSIKNRSKRINGLGNAVVPDIAESITKPIALHEPESYCDNYSVDRTMKKEAETDLPKMLTLCGENWHDAKNTLPLYDEVPVTRLPTRGFMANGVLYSDGKIDPVLNVSTRKYSGLYYTLLKSDGNNNGNPSRKTRPSKSMGSLNGQIGGALDPEFCERLMGFKRGYTQLNENKEQL